MIAFRKKYAPGEYEYRSGYREIRWDVAGCNLSCQFCWSPASRLEETDEPSISRSEEDVYEKTKGMLEKMKCSHKVFIRFTGGEPMLYRKQISKVFELFGQDKRMRKIPVLIQTNGIEIGNGNVVIADIKSITKQLCLVELSFKGTSNEEFSILTGKKPELFKYQLKAYEILNDFSQSNRNLIVVAVLGIYHSAVKSKSKYVFVNPDNGNILFDNIGSWSPQFKEIWCSAKQKWVEPLRMSPKGIWENLYKRCGPQGTGILKHYTNGISVNREGIFASKPKSYEYARLIVQRAFWS